jgi:glycosyltransferase involved in cell wall biosynthesis
VIAYHFPPIGGAGVQNTLKLVRRLPTHGYRPIVLSGPGSAHGRWAPRDSSLESEIGEHTQVERLRMPEPPAPGRWRGRADRWLGVTSAWDRWWRSGIIEQGTKLSSVELVYTSMSPFSSAGAAAELGSRLGAPWVAGLRDPWALDEMMVYPTGIHRRLERRRMRLALSSAAAVIMNTPEAARALAAAFPEFEDKTVRVVTNGYDAADFRTTAAPRRDGRFRLTHTGYLHSDGGGASGLRSLLGGAMSHVDISTRSHRYLLEAVNKLLRAQPELANVLDVCFAGVLSDEDLRIIGTCSVARSLGYLPHAESVQLLRSSDLLFLPMQNLPSGRRATIVPGKTYEYLAAGVSILGAVPDGDARDFLEAAGNSLVCRPDDVEAIATAISVEVDRWRAGGTSPTPSAAFLERFERDRLASETAAVFDAVLAPAPRKG